MIISPMSSYVSKGCERWASAFSWACYDAEMCIECLAFCTVSIGRSKPYMMQGKYVAIFWSINQVYFHKWCFVWTQLIFTLCNGCPFVSYPLLQQCQAGKQWAQCTRHQQHLPILQTMAGKLHAVQTKTGTRQQPLHCVPGKDHWVGTLLILYVAQWNSAN